MVLVNQRRDYFVNTNKILAIVVRTVGSKHFIVADMGNNKEISLGFYASKEKAQEITKRIIENNYSESTTYFLPKENE